MTSYLIRNATIVDSGSVCVSDILVRNERIERIDPEINTKNLRIEEVLAEGLYLIPGLIDDQVHFREPGLIHKGEIQTESMAAVAGGVTSYMDMPNTIPQSTTLEHLEEKYLLASKKSFANYSFYFGATNDNSSTLKKINPGVVCGIKVFMGSSTGNMLVDDEQALESIFRESPMLIAVHCEDEKCIQKEIEIHRERYGENIPFSCHPDIRNAEACYLSSSRAVALAKKHQSRLHLLHLSTAKELDLLDNTKTLRNKKITAEACIHHLWFSREDYDSLGSRIKWNPSIKEKSDKEALLQAVNDDRIDIIATDHAPHSWEEKSKSYLHCPSGGPSVQHGLLIMLELYHQNKISIESIVRKMCHAPADIFRIRERGYIREGYYADLALIDLSKGLTIKKEELLYKCQWSPFEGIQTQSSVHSCFVNGLRMYHQGKICGKASGKRLHFDR
jgi:dihydroorotase